MGKSKSAKKENVGADQREDGATSAEPGNAGEASETKTPKAAKASKPPKAAKASKAVKEPKAAKSSKPPKAAKEPKASRPPKAAKASKAAKTAKSVSKKSKAPKPAGLLDSDRELLLSLDESLAERPDFRVATVVDEARHLEVTVKKLGSELFKGAALDKNLRGELISRRARLERAESAWLELRARATPRDLIKLRSAAERLKRDAFAALRYFVAEDADVQLRLDEIYEGVGDADVIDDLRKLADLAEAHAARLTVADVPKEPVSKLRETAQLLADATAERAVDPDAATAIGLRDRAYWHLRTLMDQLRRAGRYVYRNDPKLLPLFRATSTRARRPSRAPSSDSSSG